MPFYQVGMRLFVWIVSGKEKTDTSAPHSVAPRPSGHEAEERVRSAVMGQWGEGWAKRDRTEPHHFPPSLRSLSSVSLRSPFTSFTSRNGMEGSGRRVGRDAVGAGWQEHRESIPPIDLSSSHPPPLVPKGGPEGPDERMEVGWERGLPHRNE